RCVLFFFSVFLEGKSSHLTGLPCKRWWRRRRAGKRDIVIFLLLPRGKHDFPTFSPVRAPRYIHTGGSDARSIRRADGSLKAVTKRFTPFTSCVRGLVSNNIHSAIA
ncbi:unnamed protein product, partial [Ectocarpus fasciculatus]